MNDPFYGDAISARAFWSARGYALPVAAADDDQVNEWLLLASEYIDGKYRGSFGGFKVGQRAQIRDWPRTGAADRYGYPISGDALPREVEQATYEAAFKIADGQILVRDYTPGKYKSVAITGAINVVYGDFTAADVQTQFTSIDRIIEPILTGGSGSTGLSGRSCRG